MCSSRHSLRCVFCVCVFPLFFIMFSFLTHLKSLSIDGTDWIFFGLQYLSTRSGLRESTLPPIRSFSWREGDIELSDNAEPGRCCSSSTLCCCSGSIGFCRDKTCFFAVSERFVRCSRFLWIGAMSMISGFGSNVTEHCEPWLDSGWSGWASSTDKAKRWNRSACERCSAVDETFLVRLVWWCLWWCRVPPRRQGDDDFNNKLSVSCRRFGTESLFESFLGSVRVWWQHFGELQNWIRGEVSLEMQTRNLNNCLSQES